MLRETESKVAESLDKIGNSLHKYWHMIHGTCQISNRTDAPNGGGSGFGLAAAWREFQELVMSAAWLCAPKYLRTPPPVAGVRGRRDGCRWVGEGNLVFFAPIL